MTSMTYLWLALAVVFEVGWAIGLKLAMVPRTALERGLVYGATGLAYVLSVVFLALAVRRMDIGAAYATWAGCGVAMIAVIGVLYFKEPMTVVKGVSLVLVVVGVVGLNLSGVAHGPAVGPAVGPGAGQP